MVLVGGGEIEPASSFDFIRLHNYSWLITMSIPCRKIGERRKTRGETLFVVAGDTSQLRGIKNELSEGTETEGTIRKIGKMLASSAGTKEALSSAHQRWKEQVDFRTGSGAHSIAMGGQGKGETTQGKFILTANGDETRRAMSWHLTMAEEERKLENKPI